MAEFMALMDLTIHTSPACDLRIPLARWLHPFDGCKFSRALRLIEGAEIPGTAASLRSITGPISESQLLQVHDQRYLSSLDQSATIAGILEVTPLRFLPPAVLHRWIVHPMLTATAGTLEAAESALGTGGKAICLGGGFHHAHADHGEGFCMFADIPIAIRSLAMRGRLSVHDEVLVVDLDAHRGNGFEAICHDWPVHFFDMYNVQAYPELNDQEPDRFPFLIPMPCGEDDTAYLGTLTTELPRFLDAHARARLAFYNAGTDVVSGDQLGGLCLSEDGVFQRDCFVFDELHRRGIPTAMVTSGGYSDASHRIIARTVQHQLAAKRHP